MTGVPRREPWRPYGRTVSLVRALHELSVLPWRLALVSFLVILAAGAAALPDATRLWVVCGCASVRGYGGGAGGVWLLEPLSRAACAGGPRTAASSTRDAATMCTWGGAGRGRGRDERSGRPGGVQRRRESGWQYRPSQSQTAAKSCSKMGSCTFGGRAPLQTDCGCSPVLSLNAPPAPGAHHPPTSILVRLPPRTATKRAPPHCLVHRRVLTHTRHCARSDSPEAAEHRLPAVHLSSPVLNTHRRRTIARLELRHALPRSVHSHCGALPAMACAF